MTEREFEKLKPGDEIVNKRSPGIKLTVVERRDSDVIVSNSSGKHLLKAGRHREFQQYFKQERLSL